MSFFLNICNDISATSESQRVAKAKGIDMLTPVQLPGLTVATAILCWDNLPDGIFKILMHSFAPSRDETSHRNHLTAVNRIHTQMRHKHTSGVVCTHHMADWASASFLNYRPFVCVKMSKVAKRREGKCEECKALDATPTPQEALEVLESAPQTQPSPVAIAPATKVKHF